MRGEDEGKLGTLQSNKIDEAEFEPRMDDSGPNYERGSPHYIREEAEYQVPDAKDNIVEVDIGSNMPGEIVKETHEDSFDNSSPSVGFSKLRFSSSVLMGQKRSMIMKGDSPKRGAKRSPLKKRVDDRPGITKEEEFEFKELFDLLDYDKKELIDPKELLAVLRSNKWHEKNPMQFALISEIDNEENADGITFQQFLNLFTIELVQDTSKEHIANLFRMIDITGSGTIKLEDLKKLVKEVGETVSTEELREILKKLGDGKEITFEEFYAIMSKKFS